MGGAPAEKKIDSTETAPAVNIAEVKAKVDTFRTEIGGLLERLKEVDNRIHPSATNKEWLEILSDLQTISDKVAGEDAI